MEAVTNVFIEILKFFAFFGGYGWGIVWLTIAINMALYPLTLSSLKQMSAMQKIQPKLKELQEKFKDKPQELQKETMALYKGEGVNPVGGCLPVLLKIPFFLALFFALQSSAFMQIASNPENSTGFLWVSGRVAASEFQSASLVNRAEKAGLIILDADASQKAGKDKYVWNVAKEIDGKMLREILKGVSLEDSKKVEKVQAELSKPMKGLNYEDTTKILSAWKETNSLAKPERTKLPWGGEISIFALLVGITTFFMQKSMPTAGAGQQMQMMTWFMPIMITVISWNFPAGVQIYWVISNFIAAAQQFFIASRTKKS